MDPLQQPVSEVSAVAEPQQPPIETQAQEAPDSLPVSAEQLLEHPAPIKVHAEGTSGDHNVPDQIAGPAGLDHGYNSDSKAHYHSRSTDFHHSAPEYAPQDTEAAARLNSSPSLHHQAQLHTASRPGSGLSSGPERHGLAQPQPAEVAQRQASQAAKNSVVIKVGMVGDAQIGKTSLMVKYVEGSWDEDYIQTLGM